ncbi:magnesium-translocating P-type ATPase [Streptomyces showdoensis]|uniref:Magnesium-transporting ATPase, P-type 1 n=1 Tax=Streptomyces showdoensis TaxID=68268 RepID=A0A2P2GSM7_STREW|nr:magnesium-translocating P-type ATPase [Streptomyces showdoensis]KKZ74491.1 magnesium ABC transporter ATPase [Streptomyces showdoensis]
MPESAAPGPLAPGTGGSRAPGRERPEPLTALQVLRELDTGPRGLTDAEAERRLVRYGENALPARRPPSWSRRLLRSLRDPFTAVLLCLGLVSVAVAAWGTGSVILLLVAVSCLLRSSGEHRADRATAALRASVATTATVLRRPGPGGPEARPREVPATELVPGDVVRLGPGDLVPADVRLLRSRGLRLHEAALTGESAPVDKYPVDEQPVDERSVDEGLADEHPLGAPDGPGAGPFAQPHTCFLGSSVAYGSATAVVVATGARTRLAAAHAAPGGRRDSAFDQAVHGISWTLIRFMLLTPPLVLMAGAALHGRGLETLPFAVAVAVGLTPEMLPVVVTTVLARGAARLAHEHRVIVRRLPALHDLGAVDVLCLDKTGTLTQDRPAVVRAVDAHGRDDPEVLHWAAVNAWWTLQLAELPTPDALDEALLEEAVPDGPDDPDGVAALPFDPVRRLATAVVRRPGRLGTHTLVVKGAAETVLERCALDAAERDRLLALAAREAGTGARLLAVALAERPARLRDHTPADERGLSFLGFVVLRDALAPTAAAALGSLADRGVAVRILTGDHPGTAAHTCRELGLDPGRVLTAEDLDRLDDAELAAAARHTTVFARCAPEHKARVVTALRAAGHVTGFLGDGVNDVPALRAADVGLCPKGAVAVVRDTADLVLAEKDLAAVDHAVAAGRNAGGNIAAHLHVTLSSNLGNVIAMLAAALLLPFLPMLPAQVLVQNLCSDAAQLAFAHDRPAPAALRTPTRLRHRGFLRFITGFGLLNAVADVATFGVLLVATRSSADTQGAFHAGWFTENLLTQALVMLLLRGARRYGTAPGPVRYAAAALAVTGVLLPLSPLGPLLAMTPPPPPYYLLLAAVLALYAVALRAARSRYDRRCAASAAAVTGTP